MKKNMTNECDNCIIKMVCVKACDKFECPSLVSEITKLIALRMITSDNNLRYETDDGYEVDITSHKVRIYRYESLHREDGPAVTYSCGTQQWCKNGLLHREDGPAIIYTNGTQMWYIKGKLHRKDGPAVIYFDGSIEYWQYGKLHRENGPAIILSNGTESWYKNGRAIY
jgi:hypothetical protein